MNHSSQHWHDPFAFRPERWLNKSILEIGEADDIGEKSAGQDRVEVMQVFSVGPRNCVGKKSVSHSLRGSYEPVTPDDLRGLIPRKQPGICRDETDYDAPDL